ncbi:pentatricopeptide repeat-containing protein [Dorcoceras hygrometricum]|uniref:Pentatricopeptide repeat-containing protein n=1 Tax=Dorcoceras hygrometricum TaxID=472368 RepID=A0A2Z7C3S7_9LAMI|nr:pentatricopeptide repeat-containing protein [Dorcoceras hygrometricum]
MLPSNHFYSFHIPPAQIRRPSNSAKLYLLSCRPSFHRHHLYRGPLPSKSYQNSTYPPASSPDSISTYASDGPEAKERAFDSFSSIEAETFKFRGTSGLADLNIRFDSPVVEVKELEELPEQWRRSKLAWLCKELPAHRSSTFTRVLNAQRKWIRQEDCTYIAVHCMRIRENEASFRVYKWMMQQHWFRFDFALATKLANYMGKEGKYLKCHEIFDDIINQGLIPNESTFHVLIVAYLSSSVSNALDQACSIYNRMIHLGGYKPRLSLHNSLFRALLTKTGGSCKPYLKQAEFIFHNLVTSGLEIHNDIYGGLIWFHSYQDEIDKERIESLRMEMKLKGIEESEEMLVSILRACSKAGDIVEAERTWNRILSFNHNPSNPASVYIMEVYSKIGKPMKSLEIFRKMRKGHSSSIVAYYKIIEVMCKAHEMELAESLMLEFIDSGMKPLVRSFIDLMIMYCDLNLHDKVESSFLMCQEKCPPNREVYSMYLDSLVKVGRLDRAEEILNQMQSDESIGVDARSCNTILRGYLTCCKYTKAKNVYNVMRLKKFDIESSLAEHIGKLHSLGQDMEKPIKPNLSKEQRETLVGLLLGGLKIEQDGMEKNKNQAIQFLFRENFKIHYFLKRHIYNQFREWLSHTENLVDEDDTGENDNCPCRFTTVSHPCFQFYAHQFWPQGRLVIPKLIHRWMTPRVLAYWYMYSGYRTSSGDILLKFIGDKDDALRIVKTLKTKTLDSRVKTKGSVFWIGLLGSNAVQFFKLIEPFILADVREYLEAANELGDGALGPKDDFDSRVTNSEHKNEDGSYNFV